MNSTAPQRAQPTPDAPSRTETAHSQARRKWQLYSGLFIVLKRKITLAAKRLRLHNQVVAAFAQLVQPLTCPNLSPKLMRGGAETWGHGDVGQVMVA